MGTDATSALAATAAAPASGTGHPDPLIGVIVAGRYRIEESIGAGQMARVYRARHLRLPRWFAVKVLPGPSASDPVMRLRFAQEADAASCLDHPNLVSVVDFGRIESGELYLVMDLVEGESLGDLLRRQGAFEPARAIALARALAHGLGHAHERGLVHRDFKPDNVVLERIPGDELLPRILDFGLAIRADPEEDEPRLTEAGYVVGTPIYLAPEQACAEPVDRRADLYALGVVLYELLAGQPPFDGNAVEVARKKLVEPPPRISQRNPSAAVPPALEAVVVRLMAHYPEDRYQSAAELVAALDQVETSLSRPRPVAARAEPWLPAPRPPSRPRRWHRAAIIAAAAATLLIGGLWPETDTAALSPAPSSPQASIQPRPAAFSPHEAPRQTAVPDPAAAPAPAPPQRPADDHGRLAKEYREVGEALDGLRAARGAAAVRPLETRYLALSYADSLRVRSIRRETLARLAELRRAIRAAAAE